MLATNPDYPLFTKNLAETAATMNVNLEEIIFQGEKPYVIAEYGDIPNKTEEMLKFCMQYWNILGNSRRVHPEERTRNRPIRPNHLINSSVVSCHLNVTVN